MEQIKCVYCFNEFDPAMADFRASAPIYKQGEVPVSIDGVVENPVDERYKNFLIDFNIASPEQAENSAKKFLSFSNSEEYEGVSYELIPETSFRTKIKFDPMVWDTLKGESQTRLCPHCHNELTPGFGLRKVLKISVIGDTYAGKTVFLTILLNRIVKDKGFNASLVPTKNKTALADIIYKYNEDIRKNRRLPLGNDAGKYIAPVLYSYTFNSTEKDNMIIKKNIDLAFYDIAGEDCAGENAFERVGKNIKHSDGIIFLINPMDFEIMSSKFTAHDESLLDKNLGYNRQSIIISNLYNLFMGSSDKLCDIPIAFAVSKADMLKYEEVNSSFINKYPYSTAIPTTEYESKHKGYIDRTDFKNLQDDVKVLLKEFDADGFINDAENYFSKHAFFSVSSINQRPVIEESSGGQAVSRLQEDIIPYRITDPFYWILHANGLINMINTDAPAKPEKKPGLFARFSRGKNKD